MEAPKDYFETLSYRAGLGDIHAMLLLGEWFRDKLSDTYRKLEAEWEESPDEMQKKFSDYTTENKEDALNAGAGAMWLIRAAVYGNARAIELVAKHEHWNRISLLPETFFYPGKNLQLRISGEKLRHAGLLDVTEDQIYDMESMDENGVFRAKTDAGYEGPDADGYGMEELYNFYHFDEFFHNIGSLQEYSNRDYKNGRARFANKWTEQKIAYQQQREDYWADKQIPEDSEQYKYLTSTYRGAVIQNGILKHYGEERKTTYVIPQTVTRIAAKAFSGCERLWKITIPASVEKIGYDALPKKIIICGKSGSEAERYAKQNKCLFIRIR